LDKVALEELALHFATTRNPSSRDRLIDASREMVEQVARTFLGADEPLEDLVQEGYIGLIKAADRYDPNRDVKFTTYANHLISGEIRHYLRDRKSLIREPSWLYELNQRIGKAVSLLSQELGRLPTISEIAERANLAEDSVLAVVNTRNLFRISSTDQHQEDSESPSEVPFERAKISSLRYEPFKLPVEDRILLHDGMRKLKEIERRILDAVFFGGLTQAEAARRLGISDNYVSYILKVALGKLRRTFVSEEKVSRAQVRRPRPTAQPPGLMDPLTGLLSGQGFQSRLEEEIARHSRFGTPFAYLLMDVDRLGEYNQKYGLPAGDNALAALASIIKHNLRKVDIVGKGEGGRFFAVLPHIGQTALTVAERICSRVSTEGSGLSPGKVVPQAHHAEQGRSAASTLTLAIGVVIQDETSQETAAEIQLKALKALVAAKEAGGNRVVSFVDVAPAGRRRS